MGTFYDQAFLFHLTSLTDNSNTSIIHKETPLPSITAHTIRLLLLPPPPLLLLLTHARTHHTHTLPPAIETNLSFNNPCNITHHHLDHFVLSSTPSLYLLQHLHLLLYLLTQHTSPPPPLLSQDSPHHPHPSLYTAFLFSFSLMWYFMYCVSPLFPSLIVFRFSKYNPSLVHSTDHEIMGTGVSLYFISDLARSFALIIHTHMTMYNGCYIHHPGVRIGLALSLSLISLGFSPYTLCIH
ncbi:hypothetical protein BDB00DRAFT_395288 [Zychaea mexicana]|uniref:uncharacterized protein n=1 Tax=Zychaea mexicana TaxID=64656 RepID=UPI0022FF0E26|nr:uncharacterized protein BDB00DRAFT_395288 [Zychaea mexicana]KAI9498649.1 hypothetical protein BDB00DRAFT_395288 [Zychaea mexicana]